MIGKVLKQALNCPPLKRVLHSQFMKPNHSAKKMAVAFAVFCFALLRGELGGVIDLATFPRPTMSATRVNGTEEIIIDGFLTEQSWSLADSITDFYQNKPNPGSPISERTVARVIYDDKHLYISAVCYDSHPDRIIVESLEQDFDSRSNDSFAFILDTFNDRKDAFLFLFNSQGAVLDMQISNDGADVNRAWEGIVYPKTRVFSKGWVLELAIPFNTLRFDDNSREQPWGINFLRRIRRKNEDAYWAPVETHELLLRINKAGTLSGLSDLRSSRNLNIKPFALASAQLKEPSRREADIGIDVKYGVTPSLTLDVSYNTDFSQVEADEERINLTRFPLFFPEKRDFFLENAGIFTFGDIRKFNYRMAPNRYGRDFFLFHSRRIGLAGGATIPIIGGGRLSGKLGNYELGVLDMQTADTPSADAANFGVLRLRRNILKNSNVGLMVVNKRSSGTNFNRGYGVDANFQLFRNLLIYSYYAATKDPDTRGINSASRVAVGWRDHFWDASFTYKQVDESFNPEAGFIRRRGVSEVYSTVGIHKRFRNRRLLELNPYAEINQIETLVSVTETRSASVGLDLLFADGSRLINKITNNYEGVLSDFSLYNTAVETGVYRFNSFSSYFTSNRSLPISADLAISGGGFYGGNRRTLMLKVLLRANYRLSAQLGAQRNEIDFSDSNFSADTYSLKLKYNLSTTLLNTLYIQYNAAENSLITNARLNFIHAPLSDLFVVYSEERDLGNPKQSTGYVAIKFTRLFGV